MIVTLALLEGGSLFSAVCAAIFFWARPLILDWLDVASVLGQALAPSSCCIVAFYYNDLYDLRIVNSFAEFAARLIRSFGVAFILLAVLYTVFPDTKVAQSAFFSSLLTFVGLLLPIRAVCYGVMRSRPLMESAVILGTGALAAKVIGEIEAQPHLRLSIVGVIDDSTGLPEPQFRYPLFGPIERFDKIIEELRPGRVIVALRERRGRLPVRDLLMARADGILVEDGIEVYERLTGKLAIESLTPSFLTFSRDFTKSRPLGLRRLVSFSAAVLGFFLTAPLMILIALAIKLDSAGPIFFIQDRAGLRGKPFRLVKFRTMRQTPEGEGHSVWGRNDSARITRIGRWLRRSRLDELPQFLNILKGDMDFIGPRPEMLCNVKAMTERIPYYALRHMVRPGVTGWAQVKHGYSVSLEDVTEKMRYDLYYIKHMSLWFDLRILVDSVKIVLFGRGAR